MNRKTLATLALITLVTLLNAASRAQTFSVIHTFTGAGSDGWNPEAGLTLRAGVLYGTTLEGGPGGGLGGTVFQIAHTGSTWNYAPIFLFPADGSGGINPAAKLVFGPDGHAYGTAELGGIYRTGVLFRLTPPSLTCKPGSCSWRQAILHSFRDNPYDGSGPRGDLIFDSKGNIYGITLFGGVNSDGGTVYQWNLGANTYSIIHTFNSASRGNPWSGVIVDSDGNLFGTTVHGGHYGFGTAYELIQTNNWLEDELQSFGSMGPLQPNPGYYPFAGLVQDSSGNLYGATASGGSGGAGVVFELSPSNKGWVYTPIYSFPKGLKQCENSGPLASLTLDAEGNLYGTTVCDGANGYGNVFKLTGTQAGWVYTSLYDFTGGTDGAGPAGGVTIDSDGTLYGTAHAGGSFGGNCSSYGCGVVWMIKP